MLRGEGAWLETEKGQLLDAISSWWVITHGHRHPRIVEAIKKQIDQLDQVIFAGFTHQPAEDLARGLIAHRARGPGPCLLFRQRFDRGGSGAEDGAGLLAQQGRSAQPHHRAGARLSWRHGGHHVGGRARRVQRRLRAAAVRCGAAAVSRRPGASRKHCDALECAAQRRRRPDRRAADPGLGRDADLSARCVARDGRDLPPPWHAVHRR